MDDLLTWSVLWPLGRLLLGLAAALLLASLLETLGWIRLLGKIFSPLVKFAHLSSFASASFAAAFVSSAASNAILAEAWSHGHIEKKELILANLINGFPAWCAHLPSIFLMTWPVLGIYAVAYSALTLLAAAGRSLVIVLVARILLPKADSQPKLAMLEKTSFSGAFQQALKRFRKRLPGLLGITIPCYLLMITLQKSGFFKYAENWLMLHAFWPEFLNPQVMGIIILQMGAEMGAALGAAAASLTAGVISPRDIIVALLCGSALAAPFRALRHQFPAYAGYFRPVLALQLILAQQLMRVASLCVIIFIYVKL